MSDCSIREFEDVCGLETADDFPRTSELRPVVYVVVFSVYFAVDESSLGPSSLTSCKLKP